MKDVQIIVLAGGKSSRMGTDKGLLPFENRRFIEHVLAAALTISSEIMIISHDTVYQEFGYPVYTDIYPNSGPAGGIHAGLTKSEKEINLVLACDLPRLKKSLLQFLVDHYCAENALICKTKDQLHPLAGIYRKSSLSLIAAQITAKKLKMMQVLETLDYSTLDVPSSMEIQLSNINTPAAYHNLTNGHRH